MPSQALTALKIALQEIPFLRAAARHAKSNSHYFHVERAVSRAQVVLLSSHFERYFYAVNEEIVSHLKVVGLSSDRIPEILRLLHSQPLIDDLGDAQWDRRADLLKRFVTDEAWLWSGSNGGDISHDRLLSWMKAPNSRNLIRYYKYWGIDDIFNNITRKTTNRSQLFLLVQELVDNRNKIAHGDISIQATKSDILRYTNTVNIFCSRSDRLLCRHVSKLCNNSPPW